MKIKVRSRLHLRFTLMYECTSVNDYIHVLHSCFTHSDN